MCHQAGIKPQPSAFFPGFTLLEILVAMTLVAMVTLIAVTAFRLTVQAWERVSEEGDSRQILSALPALMEKQLAGRAVLPMFSQANVNPAQYFCGSQNTLSFITSYAPQGALMQGLQWVSYRFDPGRKLLLIYEKVLTRPDDLVAVASVDSGDNTVAEASLVSQIPGISNFIMAYTSEILYNPDDPQAWQNAWNCGTESNGFPMGLMMEMTLGEGPRSRSYRWVFRTSNQNSIAIFGGQHNFLDPFGGR